MKLTTKDILKILPFEENFKKNLLDNFDSLDQDQKFNIERLIWDTYDALFELKLEENLQIALLAAKNNQEKLNDELYARVEELTEREMQGNEFKLSTEVDLEQARQKLLTLINNSPSKNN